MNFRLADPGDAEVLAKLHADNWRRHYRGAYSDTFLDGEVIADRLSVWTDRLREPDPRRCTILAEDGGLIGFANSVLEEDPTWGALIDNLHVADAHKRRGVGSRLLALTAEAVIRRSDCRSGLYLWVPTPRLSTRPAVAGAWGEMSCPRRAGLRAGSPVRLRGCDTPGRNLCCSPIPRRSATGRSWSTRRARHDERRGS